MPTQPKPASKSKPRQGRGTKTNPGGTAPRGQKKDSAARIEAFCLAYHANPNGKEAATEAGYSPRAAESTASRLLRTSKVADRLQQLAAVHESKKVASGKERREFLTQVLRGQVEDVASGGKELTYIHTPTPVAERTKAAVELAKMDGDYAAVKVDVKVTEYSRDWLKQALQVVSKYVSPDDLRKIAVEIPRFEP